MIKRLSILNTFQTLLLVVALVGFLCILYINRVPLASWWWETTRTFPEAVIFVSQDTALGAKVAHYYFDTGSQQEEYDIVRANRLYTMVLAIDPTVQWPWYQKGRIAFLYQDYEQALEYLDTFQELSEIPRPRAVYLQGVILGFMGEPEASLESLLAYYLLDSESWYIYNNLAWVYFQLGQFDEMNDISVAGLAKHPDNPWLLMNRSLALFNLGQVTEAQKYIDRSYNEANKLTEADWSSTYPGNDPLIAAMGLAELRSIIEANQELINKASY